MDEELQVRLHIEESNEIRSISISANILFLLIESGTNDLYAAQEVAEREDRGRAIRNGQNVMAWLRPIDPGDAEISDADQD